MLFRVFGVLEVDGLAADKPRRMLAALLLHANRWLPDHELIEAIWPAGEPASAAGNLKTYASRIRKLLGPDRLSRRPGAYRLTAARAELDTLVFEDLLTQAAPDTPRRAAELLTEALALWRGEPYACLETEAAEVERTRLRELHWTARDALAEALLATGRPGEAIGLLRAMTTEDPLKEGAWLRLLGALETGGRRAEALVAYQQARQAIVAELGVEPGAALREAHQRLLLADAPEPAARVAAGAERSAEPQSAAPVATSSTVAEPPSAAQAATSRSAAVPAEPEAAPASAAGPGPATPAVTSPLGAEPGPVAPSPSAAGPGPAAPPAAPPPAAEPGPVAPAAASPSAAEPGSATPAATASAAPAPPAGSPAEPAPPAAPPAPTAPPFPSFRRPRLLVALAVTLTLVLATVLTIVITTDPESAPPTATAADRLGWGEPAHRAEFTSGLDGWTAAGPRPGQQGRGRQVPERVTVANGLLTISGDAQGDTGYLTRSPGALHGRWEARVRVPPGCECYRPLLTLWPEANDPPAGGEIVYLEVFDQARQQAHFFLASAGRDRYQADRQVDLTTWNHFAVEWTGAELTGYLNGEKWFHTTEADRLPPRAMRPVIKLDLVRGTDRGPASMQVDWIREYRL